MATAKISSVMAKPRIQRQIPLKSSSTFCDNEIAISIYLKLMMNWDKAISTNVPSSAIIVSPAN